MDVAVLLALISEPPPPLSSVRPDVPAVLQKLIERILRVNADERFPTAMECRDAVLAAWNECGGVADVEETARYVHELITRTSDVNDADGDSGLTGIGA
jgi:hypothetical protein